MKTVVKMMIPVLALALATMGCGAFSMNLDFSSTRGNGKTATEERSVSDFHKVALYGSGDVTISVGDEESLTIEAEENLMPLLTSEVSGGRLVLGVKTGENIRPTQPIRYKLVVRSLDEIVLAGSGSITSEALEGESLNILLPGSGDVRIDSIKFNALEVDLAGSGRVEISGAVEKVGMTLAGSGDVNLADLAAKRADVNILGSGNVNVAVEEELNATIAGSGNIYYSGEPEVNSKILGSGEIRHD